jgi:transcriptional regulator with XRE-family HTH domain
MQIVGRRKKMGSPDRVVFGDRLRQLRKEQGLTQTALGERMGISQRLVAYYEAQGGSPSPELLVKFADALGVSTNTLLGVDRSVRAADRPNPESVRVWRRFRRVQELPEGDRKTVLRMIDAFVEGSRRKRGS